MAAHGCINLAFGDGRYDFNISPIGVACELQDKCGNVGIGTIFNRLHTGAFFFRDFRETIRLGLIGGGMKAVDALKLVERYVDGGKESTEGKNWSECVLLAHAIITAAMVGIPAEKAGKKKPATRTKTTTALSPEQPSMASAPPSASAQDKSTISPSGNSPPASMATI